MHECINLCGAKRQQQMTYNNIYVTKICFGNISYVKKRGKRDDKLTYGAYVREMYHVGQTRSLINKWI